MRPFPSLASAAVILSCCVPVCSGSAAAATCDGSSDPCSVDLGRAVVRFATGAVSYFTEAVITMGNDASVNASPYFLPLNVTHTASSENFIIGPQIYTYVGGSGIQGFHQVVATLQTTGWSFAAEPGYQITNVEAVVKGTFYTVGDAWGYVNIPAAVHRSDDQYTATLSLYPPAADMSIGFEISASYLQGEDGTALSYGAGSASIDSVEFIVSVSPVPEPASAALLGVGLAVMPWVARRRRHP